MTTERKRIFLAFPFDLQWIEESVRNVAEEANLAEVVVARDQLEAKHLLQKIRDMMDDVDLRLFDLTTHNANVGLELGVAIAEQYDYRILYCDDEGLNPKPNRTSDLFADMRGWDSIVYSNREDLKEKLRRYLPGILASSGTRKQMVIVMLEAELARVDSDLRVKTRLQSAIGPYINAAEYSPGFGNFSIGRWTVYRGGKAAQAIDAETLGLLGEAYGRIEQLMEFEADYHRAGNSMVASEAAKRNLIRHAGPALDAVEIALRALRAKLRRPN